MSTKFAKGPSTTKNDGPRINDEIFVRQMRLIGEDGKQYGVVSRDEARRIAEEIGLDLVEIAPNAEPPVVKIIDYGKFKYMEQKKQAEARKKQVVVVVKEIKLRPNIEKHDLEVKLKQIERFLQEGDKVKMYMQFRGREMAYTDVGRAKFDDVIKTALGFGAMIESDPMMMGNRIIVMLAPAKKK